MKNLLIVTLILFSGIISAQNNSTEFVLSNSQKGNKASAGKQKKKPATFRGNLKTYFKQNLQYPEEALIKGLEDTVLVTFDIDIYGNIKDPRIAEPGEIFFDEEALRVIKLMPAWNPATINGEAVSGCQILPVIFKLPEKRHAGK
ncbi:energy transducer TonB [Sporocytophaga myxococcoides]|uniref:energy transducer TonB n=1 Tax=Sporocytophaga myxococcoides TaxID=153721 RepID=UPI0004147B5A|nr:energy transducer TonB [Sporocytophaga myxococcoides]